MPSSLETKILTSLLYIQSATHAMDYGSAEFSGAESSLELSSPVHVTLMHNPKAGSGSPSKKALVAQLEHAGHRVDSYSTKDKDFIRGLESPGDLVVIAGGDGTVRKVALRLIGRNVPIAILPLGTANNIAKALGLDCTAKHLIKNLSRARSVR